MELKLRFTDAETSLAPPDLSSFAAVDHELLREQAADHDDTSLLGDLVAASIVASRMRMVDDEPTRARAPVFVQRRHWPIPAISPVSAPVSPAVEQFALADHAYGHFAWPSSRSRRPSRAGAALVLAACIPMFLPDTAAAQAAGARQPAPTSVVPPAPAPVVVAPPPAAEPTVVETAPVATAPALPNLQSILYAMKGHEAVVFVAGRKVTGLIVGVDGDFVMMVDEDRDGKIAMIPKARITEVRGKASPTVARRRSREGVVLPPDGTGMLAGGGILVAVGAPLMISGLVFVGITPSYTPIWLPQVLPALLLLGGGVPLLIFGSKRRRAYNQAVFDNQLSRRLSPSFGRTPGGGWTGGLSLRF